MKLNKLLSALFILIVPHCYWAQNLGVGFRAQNDIHFLDDQSHAYYQGFVTALSPGLVVDYVAWLNKNNAILVEVGLNPFAFANKSEGLFVIWRGKSGSNWSYLAPNVAVCYGRKLELGKRLTLNLEAGIDCRVDMVSRPPNSGGTQTYESSYLTYVEENVQFNRIKSWVLSFPLSARLVIPIAQHTSFYFKPYLNVGLDKWQAQDIQFFKSTSTGEVVEQGTAHYMNNGSRAGFVFGFLFNLKRKAEQ